MRKIDDLQIGKAGEYLVCADLILKGYVAFLAEQGLQYDVILDYNDKLYRLQIKSTRYPYLTPQRQSDTYSYQFNARRMGKGGRKSYSDTDVDIFALVALDTKQIGYISVKDAVQSMHFRVREYQGQYYDERLEVRRQEVLELHDKKGKSFSEIGKILGIGKDTAWNTYHRGSTHINGRYLDEFSIKDLL